MHAKLDNLEIPGRLIDSVVGSNGAVHIKGQAVRESDRILISNEFSRLKVGDVVEFEAANRYETLVDGTGEISSIGFSEVLQNFRTILDFHVSVRPT